MKRLFSILLVGILCHTLAYGSYFRNYQVEDGLSHNSVWTVAQDSKGFVWFGTNDGLNRFDGKEFRIYRRTDDSPYSLGHSFIHSIKEISGNRLLIGTRNGLYRYDRDFDRFEYIPVTGSRKKEVNVNDIMEDLNGNIWVACHGEGLWKLNADLQVVASYTFKNGLPTNFLWTIVSDHYGNLWIGSAGSGLVHFDPRNAIFTPITTRDGMNLEGQSIYSIFCDNDNTLWIGTSTNGLFKYNHITGKAEHYLKNTSSVKAITRYSDNELIMGSEKGLVLFDKAAANYRIIRDSDSDNATDNSIFSIARDHEGAFWIGTYFGGVNYFSPATNDFLYYNNLLESSSQKYIISGFTDDADGSMLISTHNNNVIYRFDPLRHRREKAFEVSYNNVQSLLRDGDKLYVGVYDRGVDVLSLPSGRPIENLKINIVEGNSIYRIADGGILFALQEGGCIYQDRRGNRQRIEKLAQILIASIAQDNRGTVWFATYGNGLYGWKSDGSWIHHTHELGNASETSDNGLTSLAVFGDQLWIGTKNRGILLFDIPQNKTVRTFRKSDGIPSDLILSVLCDENGNIWAGTKEGIARISARTHDIKSFGYIGKEVLCNLRSSHRAADNRLYFGGSNGFIVLNPSEWTTNESVPPVVITGLKVANRKVSPGEEHSLLERAVECTEEIVLKRSQSNFTFEFASLSYIYPEANRYAYKLDGFDKEWTYTEANTAPYMNIPAGKYVFRVKGTNNDGKWNEVPTSITVRITPPLYQNTYMILLYILITASIIALFIKWYLRNLDKKQREKEYKYQIAKEKEMYEQKINFFTDIAHEIRTPLSLITAPLENIIASNDGNEQTRKNLVTIERNTNRLLDLVNQLLDFRKIENDMFLLKYRYRNVVTIVQKVYDQYAQSAVSRGINISLALPEQKILSYIDSEALYKIISNLLSNAVKFARSSIRVQLTTEDEKMLLTVEDDGIGIKKEFLEKIFEPFYQVEVADTPNYKGSGLGLSLSKSLARKLRGDIRVQSTFGEGTLFTLELPILAEENLTQPAAEPEPAAADTQETDDTPENKTGNTAVLIVEDNEELRDFIHGCLAEYYTVYEAENGIKALEVIEANTIDIIVSDIVMPGMDGIELCNELKTNPAYSHLPIILLSAKTDTSSKIDALKKGADVYMEKPFSLEQLKAQISSIVENRANIRKKFVESPLSYFKQEKDQSENAEFIRKLNAFIFNNMSDEKFSIDSLSSEFAISRTNFQKKIKSITGLTPNDYIKLIRLNKSAELLATGKYRINEVCFLVGFNTPSYFSKCFFEHFGKLPKDFMQNNQE